MFQNPLPKMLSLEINKRFAFLPFIPRDAGSLGGLNVIKSTMLEKYSSLEDSWI